MRLIIKSSKDVGNNLEHEINFLVKYSEFLAEHTIKNEIS